MKPQTVVVTIHAGLTETGKGAAFDYLRNGLQADGIDATLFKAPAPHNVVCAAPELLAALKTVYVDCVGGEGHISAEDMDIVRAALAKATGKRAP